MNILFICLGNICRSPVAQGLCEKIYPEHFSDSAGTGGWHVGESPDHRSIAVCKKHGLDISSQKGRTLIPEDGEEFDLLFVMDRSNLEDAKNIIPEVHHHKIHMIDRHEVRDPYYGIGDGFEIMYQQIEGALEMCEWL